ncbi:MAG: tellurite resistance TerB family protein [Methylococcales bacterium]|nr:tellurite resistance TerB family protein [Methylococcales bacterium]
MNAMGLLTSLLESKGGVSSIEKIASSFLGGSSSRRNNTGKGSILLALGTLAFKAYQDHQKDTGNNAPPDARTQLLSGMREPKNEAEAQDVEAVIFLMLKAMINAAKADGTIDDEEMEKITGKAKEDGMSDEEQHFIMEEINKPMDTEALVAAVSSPQIAAQVYSVSLMAVY